MATYGELVLKILWTCHKTDYEINGFYHNFFLLICRIFGIVVLVLSVFFLYCIISMKMADIPSSAVVVQ